MIVAIGSTYHFQNLEFEGGKVGYGGEHFLAVGGHPDHGGNPAVKNGLRNILGLAHGEDSAFVLSLIGEKQGGKSELF